MDRCYFKNVSIIIITKPIKMKVLFSIFASMEKYLKQNRNYYGIDNNRKRNRIQSLCFKWFGVLLPNEWI